MNSSIKESNALTIHKMAISPMVIERAVMGLELKDKDQPLLDYLKFFAELIPLRHLDFIHAVPDLHMYSSRFEEDSPTPGTQITLNTEVKSILKKEVFSRFDKEEDKVQCEVVIGDPLERILEHTGQVEADLVVIGQKSRKKSHGILAKKLARKVKSNVLIVPDQIKNKLTKMLVPVDFSPYTMKSLKAALAMKKQMGKAVQITCLHIWEMPDLQSYNVLRPRKKFHRMIEEDRLGAFYQVFAKFYPEDITGVNHVLVEKKKPGIADYILKYAQKEGMDFIVAGAKGHSRVEAVLMGSVSEKLLSINDSIPTLVIK